MAGVVRRLLNEAGNNTIFTPHRYVSLRSYGILDGSLPQTILRPSEGRRHVPRIILHDNTLNLPVVAKQRHPDPNYAPHAAAHLLAVA